MWFKIKLAVDANVFACLSVELPVHCKMKPTQKCIFCWVQVAHACNPSY
jgi:hypothetical protein